MGQRCRTIPAVPPVPEIPPRLIIEPRLGWNAGARSIAELAVPCRLEWTMLSVVGAVCGLATEHRGLNPAGIEFAIQFETNSLGPACRAIASGAPLSDWVAYTPGATVFRIDRFRDGSAVAQAGTLTLARIEGLSGRLVTVGCLYAAGDQIGVSDAACVSPGWVDIISTATEALSDSIAGNLIVYFDYTVPEGYAIDAVDVCATADLGGSLLDSPGLYVGLSDHGEVASDLAILVPYESPQTVSVCDEFAVVTAGPGTKTLGIEIRNEYGTADYSISTVRVHVVCAL
jgi:hypothetical protein